MNTRLQSYLQDNPHLYPRSLEASYPELVERIVEAWPTPEQALAVFAELLIDHSGEPKLPPHVALELFNLSVAYDSLRRRSDEIADVWAHERSVATMDELEMGIRRGDVFRSAQSGDTADLERLLRAGMPADIRDSRDWTPLMVAAFHGHEETAILLLKFGANPRAQDRGGYTPLHRAALKGYEEVVVLLAKRVGCDAQSRAGFTPLLQAAAAGHEGVVRLLLERGADPDLATNDGWTPLHKATANGHGSVAALLLGAGASVRAQHEDGTTPASIAVGCKQACVPCHVTQAVCIPQAGTARH